MPTFNYTPDRENLEPQWDNVTPSRPNLPPRLDRAGRAAEVERQAGNVPIIGGVLKPTYQFLNALGSPDTLAGAVVGPVNGISMLGNAIGDLVQGKPWRGGRALTNPDWSQIKVDDAWTISDETTRRYNPVRAWEGQDVTPADEAGLGIGEGIGAEFAGWITGSALLNKANQIRQLQLAAQAFQRQAAVRRASVAITASPALRAGANVVKNVGQAVGSTTLAVPFLNQEDGNLANSGDVIGLNLPGRVEEGENYLQSMVKSIAVEGIAAPLALLGMGALIKPIRQGMAKGDLGWIQQLADAELEPYLPRQLLPALPPASAASMVDNGGRALPAFGESSANYGELFQQMEAPALGFDSAISRSLQEQTQIRQVTEQRQRLQDMGLVQQGEGGQLDLDLGGAVDPEIRMQIRQLQTQRGQLIKQSMESGEDMTEQLGKIDQEIGDLIQAGNSADFMPGEQFTQPELDMPDGRPELDTYLANLDELNDADLRHIHSRVYADINAERSAQELTNAQQAVTDLEARLADVDTRLAAGEITPLGAKRLIGKTQKELALAQQQVATIEARGRVSESLVGDQLQLRIEQQGQLDLTTQPQLPPLEAMTRTASEYGYRTPDDYRSALQGWSRDQLRRLAMPDSSPEVAALVKARTGRRVWSAKKDDIIDALVELSEKRGRYLPPEAEQLAMELKANQFGDAAPLFDRPADLSAPGMTKTLDADGNEVLVPMTDYSGRGMDAGTRERLKAEILQRAIDNGEVQPPVSPLPQRPVTVFEQSSLVDDLFSDPTGQMALAFSSDALPTYKAGGKNVDALLEEMRLRFEYNLLDEQAQQAQRQAMMAAHGWDTLPWEEKKKLGILTDGFYSLKPYSERFQDPTPAARSDLDAPGAPVREPKVYTWKPGGEVAEEVPAPKLTKQEAAALKKQQAAEARAAKAEVQIQNKNLAARREALLKQQEELLRQSQGAKC